MNAIQALSLELLDLTADLIKASREGNIHDCEILSKKIITITTEINKVMETYKISC